MGGLSTLFCFRASGGLSRKKLRNTAPSPGQISFHVQVSANPLSSCRNIIAPHEALPGPQVGIASTPDEKHTGYEPSPWGDFFIGYKPLQGSEEWMIVRVHELKEDVHMLFKNCNNATARMFLLDTLQHLGIDHHFEDRIDAVLTEIMDSAELSNSSSLQEVALRFRLLREHGYWVSPDVFNKFRADDGSFSKYLTNDPRGLLSLYNAAHLLAQGEPVLEEAITFAKHHLESMSGSLKSPLAEEVKRALHIPLPRTCKRAETLHYISEYEKEEGHDPILLELAKLDFNLLQHVHLKELRAITEWWKHFSGNIGLSYIRDRVVESYTWSYVLYYEKGYEFPRSIITKMIVLITTIDDTYDIHATIEECRKLRQAIQRWDEGAISVLPEYLKKLYIELLRTFKNIETEMPININFDIAYLKKAIQNNVTGYLQEAEWSHENHKPSFKEQINLTSVTIGTPTLCVCMAAGMDNMTMRQTLEWTSGVPGPVVAAAKIVRFMNDIAGTYIYSQLLRLIHECSIYVHTCNSKLTVN
ncbi:hypothetical protein BRADI_5g01766v3 [Brachypodium distachyon]|uniref:Uncharacterized protein n=1 Tax=Brachypodium distachyon TaxID=15368 RepID=A0A2K2CEX1_BRADI|nr:hypothetical protein BRADI_5g01766v3 [Brachypodium distachyon]